MDGNVSPQPLGHVCSCSLGVTLRSRAAGDAKIRKPQHNDAAELLVELTLLFYFNFLFSPPLEKSRLLHNMSNCAATA